MRRRCYSVAFLTALLAPSLSAQTPHQVASIADALEWRQVGPTIMGGRISDLAVVESDPSTFYVGTATGGIWKTENAGITFDPINYHRRSDPEPVMPTSFETHEDILNGFRALTAPGTEFIRHQNSSDANVAYIRVKDYLGEDRFVSLVINRWHDNVNTMFGEDRRLDASKDTIDFVLGSIGSYPNFFLVVDTKDLPDFFDLLANFDGSELYLTMLDRFGVNRSDPEFWDTYDWFQKQLNEADPLQAGLYDLNRYYPSAH